MNLFSFRKALLLSVFSILSQLSLFAQTSQISGSVKDSSGNSISFVSVLILETGSGTSTDQSGHFRFNQLNAGNYSLSFSRIGFKPYIKTITVNGTENSTLSIQLRSGLFAIKEFTTSARNEVSDAVSVINSIDLQLRPTNSAQDLLRLVPGLFIAQHAGGGKAEQIFLRGFDSDHGTDFFVNLDGMPVNMVSHAHGQGYADFHFVIPETIDQLSVSKGPFNARYGDFATSGAGTFTTTNALQRSQVKFEYGQFDTYRMTAMVDLLQGKHLFTKRDENLYIAGEYNYSNAYFESNQHFNRTNIFGKYSASLNDRTFIALSGSTFNSKWDASGQIPERAILGRQITRFGSIDDTEGGNTDRSNVNLIITSNAKNGGVFKNQVYYSRYNFNLFSNFTFFLNDPVYGDQIRQTDTGRNIYGYTGSYEKKGKLGSKELKSVIGLSTRIDQAAIFAFSTSLFNALMMRTWS